MSRRKPADNSTAVSLFPFLAVLLCTMGALLVVLVAVSRAAREAALRASDVPQAAAPAAESDPKLREEIDRIEQFNERLRRLRGKAEERLREDQLRLGQLESHMRRLQNQLDLLYAAALELQAMEEEHYDDREQAQREHERLQRLIAEKRAEIDDLKEQIKSQKRTYALIPYEGPNGTFRRPIYIECRKNELILQPEGVRVARDDLYPPYGAGNPLAAALRAARDYYVGIHPGEGRSRDTEPYPLLVVRPEGLLMYDRARRAVQGADLEFGFELVEDDWDLHYHTPDPQLASLEQHAIEQARIRQQALAAAAPRAYRRPAMVAAGDFDFDEGDAEAFGFSGDGVGGKPEFGGGAFDNGGAGQESGATASNDDPIQLGGNGGGDTFAGTNESPQSPEASQIGGAKTGAAGGTTTQADGNSPTGTGTAGAQTASAGQTSNSQGGAGGDSSIEPNAGNNVVVSNGQPSPEPSRSDPQATADAARGRDWALARKKPNDVPIRRTIQVVVRKDHVAILDERQANATSPTGKRIDLPDDTIQSLDKFAAAIRKEIDGWGIAGQGLYWRPVLLLNVGPDGQRRAEDLAGLLKNSGLELRMATAANDPQGASRATR